MDINTLQNNIAQAIHDDADTRTWCVAKYDRQHKVFIGSDPRKPPADDEYPLVRVWKSGKVSGYSLDEQEHTLSVLCGIHDATVKTLVRDNLVQYESTDDIETFRKYVETAVADVISMPYFIASMEVEFEPIEFFPYLLAGMEIKINYDYSQGDDPFA